MLKNTSIVTVDAPEFINVTPYNDLISECEIKVLYLGENRNRSIITKDVAIKMANSLPGMPIVAAYRQDKEDFSDHGNVITVEDGEIKFSCKTVPYGFVSPDAKIWFQKFLDIDEQDNMIEREYLMTTGFLWTGQYPEIKKAIDEGLPQSMELSEDDLSGYWATDSHSGIDFFIINDATFTKLCILGSDVEPCFEGASVTSPKVSKDFSKNESFVDKLLSMKKELNYALIGKGGSDMNDEPEILPVVEFDEAAEGTAGEAASDTENSSANASDNPTVEGSSEEESEETEEETVISTDVSSKKKKVDFAADKKEEEEDEKVDSSDTADDAEDDTSEEDKKKNSSFKKEEDTSEEDKKETDTASDDSQADDSSEEDDSSEDKKNKNFKKDKPNGNHSLEEVENEFNAVKAAFDALTAEHEAMLTELNELRSYKLKIEESRKDAEIAKYYMLNDEDKADIIAHKSEYSLSEIQAKLALLYVEKNVDFSLGQEEETVASEPAITTFSLDSAVEMNSVSPMVQSLLNARKN